MTIQCNYKRYWSPHSMDCESVEEAIRMAAADLENGEGWPVSTTDGKKVLWTSADSFTASKSLTDFAAKNGITLPDYF